MADLDNVTPEWVDGIRQLEETDPVLGGPPNETTGDGIDNIPHFQLAKRTQYLKAELESRTSPNAILAAVLGLDGPGSGLNADLLDGQHASYFARATDLASSTSDAAIIAAVKRQDGAGSGVDADTVDGKHASVFSEKSANLSDLSSPAAARSNLNLGTMATAAEGTSDISFRNNAANDLRFLIGSNNLSDLSSPAAARENLNLGTMATAAEGTSDISFRNNAANDSRYVQKSGDSMSGPLIIQGGTVFHSALGVNQVGSVVQCKKMTSGDIDLGAFISGGNLRPSGSDLLEGAFSLSGTWEALGRCGQGGVTNFRKKSG